MLDQPTLLQRDVLLQALTLTMIAYATFAHSPPESLLTAVSEHALLSLNKFEQQAIANLIWALALLHALTPNMWNQLLEAFSNVDDQQGVLLSLLRSLIHGSHALSTLNLETTSAGCRPSHQAKHVSHRGFHSAFRSTAYSTSSAYSTYSAYSAYTKALY